jgi:hypothetical protein
MYVRRGVVLVVFALLGGCGGAPEKSVDGKESPPASPKVTSALTAGLHFELVWWRADGVTSHWTVNTHGELENSRLIFFGSDGQILSMADVDHDGEGDYLISTNGTLRLLSGDRLASNYGERARPTSIPSGLKTPFVGYTADAGPPFIIWRGRNWTQSTTERWVLGGPSNPALGGHAFPYDDSFETTGSYALVGTGRFNLAGSEESGWMLRDTSGNIRLRMDPWSGQEVTHFMPSVWTVSAIADLNGDGLDDIVWRNSQTTSTAVWGIGNGGQVIANIDLSGPIAPWSVRSAGDLDGDGNADIIWRHSDGWVAFWMMDQNFQVREYGPAIFVGSEWSILGVISVNH